MEELFIGDFVRIVDFPPRAQSETDANAEKLRSYLLGTNNQLYVILKNGKDALQKTESTSVRKLITEILKAASDLESRTREFQWSLVETPNYLGSQTILIVDDEETVRTVVARSLKKCGYKTLQASDGEEALKVCNSYTGEIHVLLSDIEMQPMNGYELTRKIALLRPETKIVYMSGGVVDHSRCLAGADFLQKPLELMDALPQRIWTVLNRA